MKNKALIIGNSDGIGLALTKVLLERGWKIAGISKSTPPIKNKGYRHYQINVRDENYTSTLQKILKENDFIDLCVYCVGMGELLDFSAMEREIEIIDVNLLGMVRTAAQVIPSMINRGRGYFIGLSSLADALISARAPSYHASKAGFSSYLEGLALALKEKGVHITNVRFGFVDTKLAKGESRPFMMSKEKAVAHLLKCIKKKPVRYSAPRIMIPLVKYANRILRIRLKKAPVSMKP